MIRYALALILMIASTAVASAADPKPPADDQLATVGMQVNIKINLAGARNTANLVRTDDGLRYRIFDLAGNAELLTPEEFARRLWRDATSRTWFDKLLNISSPIGMLWVLVGLGGQVLFTGRMIVQWLVSEKARRSVVPPVFWWMSLIGATMLIIYFTWRMDIVGILGQATGWLIYVRNLWMIYRPGGHGPTAAADPGPQPEL